MLPVYVAGGLLALVALWAAYTYNLLVRMRNKAEEAFSGIDVQLKQRRDLIPNLVAAVSAYTQHERALFECVAAARSVAAAAAGPADAALAENVLAGGMRRLVAVAEQYADLRASQNYLALMREITDVENEIVAARDLYNQNVRILRSHAESVPANIVAARVRGLELPYLTFERVYDEVALSAEGFAA